MFQVRLRLRLAKNLDTPDTTRTLQIGGRTVLIRSSLSDGMPLNKADWIALKSHGFQTEAEATAFGVQLKHAVSAASVCCLLGVDLGNDQSGAWMDTDYARSIGFIKPHQRFHTNVHGLAVLEDDPNIIFPVVQATATVHTPPKDFLDAIVRAFETVKKIDHQARNSFRLLNQAITNPQSLAKLVLAISAVEALGQDAEWSAAQDALRQRLAASARSDPGLSEAERNEVADMVTRGHRIGLRQGVKRVLTRLDLLHLMGEWDRIYGIRSGIVHGTTTRTEAEIGQLAAEATNLSGAIVLRLAQRKGFVLPEIAETHFPGSSNPPPTPEESV